MSPAAAERKAGGTMARLGTARRLWVVLVGAFICFMLSAVFFPNQLQVEAQTQPKPAGKIDEFKKFWNGDEKGTFCGKSAGLLKFKELNRKHWSAAGVPAGGNNEPDSREGFFLTLRIVSCMIGTENGDGAAGLPGAVIFYGRAIITAVSTLFMDIILAVAMLAFVLLGIRIAAGQHNEFLPSTFVNILKFGLLLAAVTAMPHLYDSLVSTINQWSGELALRVPSYLCSEYKAGAIPQAYLYLAPWAKLDCAAQSMVEIGANARNSPLGQAMILALSSGIGKATTGAFMGSVYAMAAVLEIAIMIMLLAHIAIVMLMMIAPLAWVCIFFHKTRDYFTRWLGLMTGFVLQPILLSLFLVMFVNIFESVMCSSSYSVVAAFNKSADDLGLPQSPTYQTLNGNATLKSPGGQFGPKHCSVPMINRAFLRISAAAEWKNVFKITSVTNASDEQGLSTETLFSRIESGVKEFADAAKNMLLDELVKANWPTLTSLGLSDKVTKALTRPFLAIFTAFVILFVLFSFLKQLPEFVNLLAAAAVDSGNINKATRFGGEFGKSAMSGLGGMSRGFEQGLRGAEGNMQNAQQGLLQGLRDFGGRG